MTRVWDAFLTDRDKQHVAIANKRKPVGWGNKPALLMIDNYQGVFSEPGVPLLEAIKSNPSAMGEEAWAALANVKTLLEHARAADIPVIHITAMHGNNMMGWSPMVHAGDKRGQLVPSKPADTARSEIMADAAPLATEVVLQKTAPSAFWGTPLAALLNWLGVDTLIIGGESASGCVRASVVEAASYRYRSIVVEDCTYDRHEACRAINLFDMHEKYADVLPLDEVLEWVDKHGAENGSLAESVA
jgi:maleamate amidohydrolase